LADGATNVALLLIAAGSATFWSAIVASGALYLRSPRVRDVVRPSAPSRKVGWVDACFRERC
jgi:hypothetical protein